MSLRIHICNNDTDADLIIETERITSGNPTLPGEKLTVPDIMVRDHSAHVDKPQLLNQNKICVVFRDP